MMDEIEDEYKISLEKIEEEFYAELQKGKPLHEIEKLYLVKLKRSREQYERSFRKYLEKQKRSISSKNQYKTPQTTEPLKVEHLDLSESRIDRINFRAKIFLFRLSRAMKNLHSYLSSKKLLYFKFVIRINAKRTVQMIKDALEDLLETIKNKTILILTYIGNFFVFIYQKFKDTLSKVKRFFVKKKEEKKGDEEKKSSEGVKQTEPEMKSESLNKEVATPLNLSEEQKEDSISNLSKEKKEEPLMENNISPEKDKTSEPDKVPASEKTIVSDN